MYHRCHRRRPLCVLACKVLISSTFKGIHHEAIKLSLIRIFRGGVTSCKSEKISRTLAGDISALPAEVFFRQRQLKLFCVYD